MHKRLLSILLILALLMSFAVQATADENSGSTSSGMVIDKTAKAVDDGFEITLEAYATGSKVITSTNVEIPTDIVLVLDLSSSMKETMNTYTYTAYSGNNTQNTKLYANRHNGGNSNLWYQVDGKYYSVSVTCTVDYTAYATTTSNSTYYNNSDNLYELVNGEYKKVTLTRSGRYNNTYTFTFSDGTTVTSNNANSAPDLNGHTLYAPGAEGSGTVYTYSYTANGNTTTICTSTGSTIQVSGYTFYQRNTASGTATRLDALKEAVNAFVNSVYTKAQGADGAMGTDDDVNHRIAIVGFNTNATAYTKENNSLAFVDMDTENVNIALQAMVSNMSTSTGTKPAEGVNMANDLFASNPIGDGEQRNRIVILFTDGYPSTSGPNNFDTSLANSTISATHTSKETYGATVYTIAVLDGADPTADISINTSLTGNTLDVNKYLHYASSNYPDATSMTSGGNLNTNADPFNGGKSYYLVASDSGSLTTIFENIASEVESGGSSTTLSSSTVIKDIIAPQFQLPVEATTDNITLETWKYNGPDSEWTKNDTAMGATATIDQTNGKVDVTGFDFAANYVGTVTDNGTTTYRGNKLVIRFTVQVKDGFLGGNDVYTNTSAGVYENANATEPVLTFPRPQVNVPIKEITIEASDKNVYLTQVPDEAQLKGNVTIKCGNVDITDPSKLEDWQKAYVTIDSSFTTSNGFNATEDGSYTITASVTPTTETPVSKEGTTATKQEKTENKKINVFKPELTYKDSTVWYGGDAPTSYDGNLTKTEWKHGETLNTSVTMIGNAPELTKTYTPGTGISNGKVNTKNDIPVDVTVKIGSTDVTGYTNFKHQDCTDRTDTLPEGKEFLLHVNTCSLTITKQAANGTTIGNDEFFVFTIKKDGAAYTQVTIQGTGSVTIKELPVGTYTVEEDEATAWRYEEHTISEGVTLNSGNSTGTITCTNGKRNDKWLNHFARVINTYDPTKK